MHRYFFDAVADFFAGSTKTPKGVLNTHRMMATSCK